MHRLLFDHFGRWLEGKELSDHYGLGGPKIASNK